MLACFANRPSRLVRTFFYRWIRPGVRDCWAHVNLGFPRTQCVSDSEVLDKLVKFLETKRNKKATNKEVIESLGLWKDKSEFREWRHPYVEKGTLVLHRGRGGSVSLPSGSSQLVLPSGLSQQASNLLGLIPKDGSSVGNTFLQSKMGISADTYWKIRQELLDAKLVQVGRGRGGSVSLTSLALQKGVETSGAEFVKLESDLYKPLRDWLVENWVKNALEAGDYAYAEITASPEGRKRDSGQWTRPDVTFVRVNRFENLPGSFVEVTSFEVKKNADSQDLAGVYEAAAHQRGAHNTYLVAEVADPEDVADTAVEKECGRLGVGLMTLNKTSKGYSVDDRLEPEHQEPPPENLDLSLKGLFAGNPKEMRKFKTAIGK